jgi:hypothetical protein
MRPTTEFTTIGPMGLNKQAKTLSKPQIKLITGLIQQTRYHVRNRAIFLLYVKAGLRAKEIANLTWEMVTEADGRFGRLPLVACHVRRRVSFLHSTTPGSAHASRGRRQDPCGNRDPRIAEMKQEIFTGEIRKPTFLPGARSSSWPTRTRSRDSSALLSYARLAYGLVQAQQERAGERVP